MKFSGIKHNPIFGNHCCAIITLSISRTFSTSQNKLTVYKPRPPTLCFCLFAYLFIQFVGLFLFWGVLFLVLYFLQWGALNQTSIKLYCLDFLLYIYPPWAFHSLQQIYHHLHSDNFQIYPCRRDLLVMSQTNPCRFYITVVTSVCRKVNPSHYPPFLSAMLYITLQDVMNRLIVQIKNANIFESSCSQPTDHIIPAVNSSERNWAAIYNAYGKSKTPVLGMERRAISEISLVNKYPRKDK